MHLRDAFIYRIVGAVNPPWRARLLWAQESGDRAGKSVVNAVVHPGDTAVDVGANLGLYTDRLARVVGHGGRVFAFEPHPAYTRALTRIAAAHGNVTFIPCAASSQAGHASLSVPAAEGHANPAMASLETRTMHGSHTVTVPTTTLDAELAHVVGVQFLKCDVEGHEHEVLTGGLNVLERECPVLLIEIEQRHRQRPLQETFDLLHDLGYDGHALTRAGPRPLATFDVERDQLRLIADDPATGEPPAEYVNDFLFVPAGSPVRI